MKHRKLVHLLLLLAMLSAFVQPALVRAQEPSASGGTVWLPSISAARAASVEASSDTPAPTSVTVAGSLQSEAGCSADWTADCAGTHLTYDAGDDVWQGSFTLPAGGYEYKATLNDSWDENYGVNAVRNGTNIPLNLAADASVRFYYDHETHWVADSASKTIVTVPGSFQSEIGCGGDWQPDCLRSWLQDTDGDGTYTRVFPSLPAGNYEAKVTINENWDENYGAGGAPNGPNIGFSVPEAQAMLFSYNAASHILTVSPYVTLDAEAFGHNSHSDLYRVPFGSVTPGTEITLRFRTLAGDAEGVRVRVWDDGVDQQFFLTMQPAASGVPCFDDALAGSSCDFWEARYTPPAPTVLFYRFLVNDGALTGFYDDDAQRDGGWGEATPGVRDNGYAINVYHPSFQPVEWMQDAVIYQIFPDRFRNGRSNNDAKAGEPRYSYPSNPLDQILPKAWGSLPEGYCRHYAEFECTEEPRGRDYFGGDLRGVQQRLNYLQALGVTAIYFNPIFEAGSNHAYDTQDYYKIDHFFGSNDEFVKLAREAQKRGIRIILDGVFNHVSSDSPYFDRYGRFAAVGACESVDSPYRDWFTFRADPNGPCAGPGGTKTNYDAWFGFDSLPVLNKSNAGVQDLVYGPNGVAQFWLKLGADAWRLDVMGDTSFPGDFWPEFRAAVKAQDPDAAIIGELWKKFEVLAHAQGATADTSMNYRFRNAVLGYFGQVDFKGFADDGQSFQPPSTFANKMISVREDNPDAVYTTLMNILDSHDTQRILWSLTPGVRNPANREFNADNLAQGKRMLRLAAVVQMTTPGAPTIYYGDEVGVTGEDDPDDRRTMPWNDSGPYGVGGDPALLAHYQKLTALRAAHAVLRDGELSFLLLDDAASTMAYLMRTPGDGAIVAINRNSTAQTLAIPLGGALPAAVQLVDALGTIGPVQAVDGILTLTLPAAGAAILLPTPGQDLIAPVAPQNLAASDGNGQVTLAWSAVADAVQYVVYRSVVQGGGYVEIARTSATSYVDSGLANGAYLYYVVRALDDAANLGERSNEAAGLPRYTIGWANLQWPPATTHTISAVNRTENIFGQVWIDGVTSQPGVTPTLRAQAGFGPDGSNPAGDDGWTWVEASFNGNAGNNDEFMASFLPEAVGAFDYLFRYTTTGGAEWLYADLNGPVAAGAQPANPGSLTVNSSGDTTPPNVPQNLNVTSGSPAGIALDWEDATDETALYGYELLRGDTAGGPYTQIARLTVSEYTDTSVEEGRTYFYVVRALDMSFNRSANSNEAQGEAARRLVTLTFNVTVPAATDGTSLPVNIAGTLNRLQGGLPEWNPGGTPLTRVDATLWTITVQGFEGTELEYKYALGSWDFVEKDGGCAEIANRPLLLVYGAGGVQTVNDTVENWRNVAPCGN